MNRPLKTKLAFGALIIGGLAFLDGSMLLGNSAVTFAVATGLTAFAALLGARWIRVAGIILCAASVAMGVLHLERKQRIEGVVKSVRESAATNSVSR